jgi:hypothetical protein
MCISPDQQRQKDEARKESMDKTMGVNATGEKSSLNQYDQSSNQINNE